MARYCKLLITKFRKLLTFEEKYLLNDVFEVFPLVNIPCMNIRLNSNLFSDLLFQSWYYGNCPIKPHWLLGANIPTENNISVEEFKTKYENQNEPVVLKNIVNSWPSFKNWSWEFLKGKRIFCTFQILRGYNSKRTNWRSFLRDNSTFEFSE